MRTAIVLICATLAAGCGHSRVREAQEQAALCDYQRGLAAAAGDRARADRIAVDCEAWRNQIAIEQTRAEDSRARRARAGAAFHSMGEGRRSAGDAPAPPPRYRCRPDYLGGTICEPSEF